MAEYHVGAGAFGIYAGTLQKSDLWRSKSEVTDEAINAVRDYMIEELLGGVECSKGKTGGWQWTMKDGRTVELRVTVKDGNGGDDNEEDDLR